MSRVEQAYAGLRISAPCVVERGRDGQPLRIEALRPVRVAALPNWSRRVQIHRDYWGGRA